MTKTRTRVAAITLALLLPSAAAAQGTRPRSVDACISSSESAQVDRSAGHLRASKDELARCLAPDCPPLIRKDCEAYLAEVERAMPTVVFRVRNPDGTDVVDAEVRVDGETRATSADGRVRDVDPGAHDIEVVVPGRRAVHLRIVAEETVKGRVVEVTVPGPAPVVVVPPPRDARAEERRPTTLTWAGTLGLGGLGVVGLGTFAVVGLSADADYRTLRDTCGTRCAPASTEDVRDRFRVADVALGVGVVALAASALVWVFGPRTEPAREPRTAGAGP